MLQHILSWFNVFLVVVGIGLVVVGAGLVFVPAGFMVAGVFLIVSAYLRRALEVLNADS